jgi:hypothetical protein
MEYTRLVAAAVAVAALGAVAALSGMKAVGAPSGAAIPDTTFPLPTPADHVPVPAGPTTIAWAAAAAAPVSVRAANRAW